MRWYIRMVKMVVVIAAVSIISSLLTIGTTALVVDGYIQTALQQFNVPIKREPMTAVTLWSSLWKGTAPKPEQGNRTQLNPSGIGKAVKPGTGEEGSGGSRNGSESSGSAGSTETQGASQGSEQGTESKPTGDDALPVWGSVSEEANGLDQQEEVIVTPEALKDSKEQLPANAKDEIFRTLLQKLPQEDWQRISTLMEGGLTSSEISEVEQILAKHLNDEEYKKMRDMLAGSKAGKDSTIPAS
ncbi:spore coat protein [Paenibacillus marinisediminis]